MQSIVAMLERLPGCAMCATVALLSACGGKAVAAGESSASRDDSGAAAPDVGGSSAAGASGGLAEVGAGGTSGAAGNGGAHEGGVEPTDAESRWCVGWCTCPAGDLWIELSVNNAPPVLFRAGVPGGGPKGGPSFGGCGVPLAFTDWDQKVVGVGGCLATVGMPPCIWLGSDGTGRYIDDARAIWDLAGTAIAGSASISSCSSPYSGYFKATTDLATTDGGLPLVINGSFRVCPEGPEVL